MMHTSMCMIWSQGRTRLGKPLSSRTFSPPSKNGCLRSANFSNVNSLEILRSGHPSGPSDIVHLITLSFIGSPWEYPGTFQAIPSLTLRTVIDPESWEVVNIDARLSFSSKILDVMLPSRYVADVDFSDFTAGVIYDFTLKITYPSRLLKQ